MLHHNPLLSGDFQPSAWERMWGSGRVAEYSIANSIRYGEGDKTSRSAYLNDAFKRQERLPLSSHRLSSSNLTRET